MHFSHQSSTHSLFFLFFFFSVASNNELIFNNTDQKYQKKRLCEIQNIKKRSTPTREAANNKIKNPERNLFHVSCYLLDFFCRFLFISYPLHSILLYSLVLFLLFVCFFSSSFLFIQSFCLFWDLISFRFNMCVLRSGFVFFGDFP